MLILWEGFSSFPLYHGTIGSISAVLSCSVFPPRDGIMIRKLLTPITAFCTKIIPLVVK